MIELKNIYFRYDSAREIFKSFSLTIDKGSSVAIVGNSGCGKTTLLNLIAGILKPNSGEIRVYSNNISYLMQNVTLLPYRTALENLLLAYELRNKTIDENIKRRAIDLVLQFQINKNELYKYPYELSEGMKQRMGLAQTLLTESELLLLDEPFNAIDINALEKIETYLWDYIKKKKCTMVFITHNIEHALTLSDRIIVLKNDYTTDQVRLSEEYVALSPSERLETKEYQTRYFETISKMKL